MRAVHSGWKRDRKGGAFLLALVCMAVAAILSGCVGLVTPPVQTPTPAAAPTFSPAGGTYNSAQTVTISDATPGASIYYTTDGTIPTTSSTAYTAPLTVSASQTINAIATATGYTTSALGSATYTIQTTAAATPTFSPVGGTYSSAQTVTISDTTPGTTIYYTTDGTTPTTSSTPYTGPITVGASQTVNAIATAIGFTTSAVGSATYTIQTTVPAATPTFSPAGGTYSTTQTVTISDATPGASIYYTTNGTIPTTSSTLYTAPLTVSASQTINAIATATGYTASAVGSATYTIQTTVPAATPTFSPAGGTYSTTQTVTISDATPGASIYYTTNGTIPTTSSTPYTAPITVSASQTINAIATATGLTTSAVGSAAYLIPQSLTITGSILANATKGVAYTSTNSAVAGTLPYTWTVSAGQLPPGLTITGTTGNISGTPTASGVYKFTLKVADSSSPQQSAAASYTITVSTNIFDQYGGLTAMPSPNAPTGLFRAEKFGNKWMFVDPDNNGFFMIGIYVFAQDQSIDNLGSSYYLRTAAKYGDNGPIWATAQLKRIQSWGFNASGTYASSYVLPTTVQNGWPTPDHTNPVKAPFLYIVRPAYYGMLNQYNWSPQPIKNMLFGASQYYTGFRPNQGVADYYDNNLQTFFTNEMTDPVFTAIKSSANKQYLIGMNVDDGDQMYGFGNGPDFPNGRNNAHLGWLVLTMSPVQSANDRKKFVYADTTVYSKRALHDQLVAKYGTIAALNAAWSSSYTTFESSGTVITGEGITNGDGSTTTFTKTLANPAVSAFSLQIFVAGLPVGGDTGKGIVWGPNLSGTISYSTGALSLTFSSGHAPASGAAITVNYVQNGWGIGTGLMDEDGRPADQPWVGRDFTFMADVNANLKSDLDSYLYQIAAHYFSMCRTVIQNWMPGVMYLGPDSLGTWAAPSNRNVLKAASQYIDVMLMGGNGTALSQTMLDFIYTYYGDKPFVMGEFRTANADSALFSYPDSRTGSYPTQQLRGQNYLNTVTTYPAAAYANGSRPYIGILWWRYLDNWSEKLNWGLVSLSDNAYDGHESVPGPAGVGVRSIRCSPPLELYLCGGEEKNYGDIITSVTQANQQIMQGVQK